MTKVWWALLTVVGGACSPLPSFPGGGASGAGGQEASGGEPSNEGEPASGGAGGAGGRVMCGPETGVSANCQPWVACDSCASACDCDEPCIDKCKSGLYLSINQEEFEEVKACDASFVECFSGPDRGRQCAALVPCCEHFATSDDGKLCQGIVADGSEAVCLLLRAAYARSGGCP